VPVSDLKELIALERADKLPLCRYVGPPMEPRNGGNRRG
jgi:hypothetical protein